MNHDVQDVTLDFLSDRLSCEKIPHDNYTEVFDWQKYLKIDSQGLKKKSLSLLYEYKISDICCFADEE